MNAKKIDEIYDYTDLNYPITKKLLCHLDQEKQK